MANCNTLLMILSFLLLATVLVIVFYPISKFGDTLLNNNYNSGCEKENRQYPEGNIPGSYLGLNKIEREGLLTNFVNNDPNKLT
jgi:hypothetical protein